MEDEFWRREELHAPAKRLAVPAGQRDPRGPGWDSQGPEAAVPGKPVPAHEDQQQDGDQSPGVARLSSPSPDLLERE